MVLDPFTAAGLAGNIVQFIHFSSDLIVSTAEIHKSATGASANHVHLEGIATRLRDLVETLEQPNLGQATKQERSLNQLRDECLKDAESLLGLINGLRAENKSKWESFRKAVKSSFQQDEISRLERRLADKRNDIAVQLSAMSSQRNSAILNALNAMAEESQVAGIKRSEMFRELRVKLDNIANAADELLNSRKREFDKLTQDIPRLETTRQDLEALTATAAKLSNEQKILKSLRFDDIKVRHEKIKTAYETTLQWIVEEAGPHQPIKFREWLESTDLSHIPYWVSGKPGSGKSTLMKFICDHPSTTKALQIWAGSDHLVIATFFFWLYGTPMQKSQKGFLQTLLHEILRQCPDLIQPCLPHRWETVTQDVWTERELLEALETLGQGLATTTTKFCFFIDGLDEYDGEPRQILPVLRGLSMSPHIKLCVSSRPWQIFKDEFDNHHGMRLYLHELTRRDIQSYVKQNFENDRNFQQRIQEDAQYQVIIDEVVERAQGVWVWVALVTLSLLEGLTNGDSLATMRMRLQHIPVDLEEFFQQILDSVDSFYQGQMAETFLVALAANESLPLILYSFMDDIRDFHNFAIKYDASVSKPLDQQLIERELNMTKRLNARTKGLLEVSKPKTAKEPEKPAEWRDTRVDFLHRTVGDFLNRTDIKERFQASTKAGFNAYASLCHGYLALIKAVSTTYKHSSKFERLVHDLLDSARAYESNTAGTQTVVIDELERYLSSTCYPKPGTVSGVQQPEDLNLRLSVFPTSRTQSIFELCCQHGLIKYVDHRLKMDETLSSYKQWWRPLLSQTLFPSEMALRFHRHEPKGMTHLLLNYGVDPNEIDGTSTPWILLVQDMVKEPSRPKLELMELFVSNGADPSAGLVLLNTLTILSFSPAKEYQAAMFDMLIKAGANPNAKYDNSTVWRRYLNFVIQDQPGRQEADRQTDFKQIRQLLWAGADPDAVVRGLKIDEIILLKLSSQPADILLDVLRDVRAKNGTWIPWFLWNTVWRQSPS